MGELIKIDDFKKRKIKMRIINDARLIAHEIQKGDMSFREIGEMSKRIRDAQDRDGISFQDQVAHVVRRALRERGRRE